MEFLYKYVSSECALTYLPEVGEPRQQVAASAGMKLQLCRNTLCAHGTSASDVCNLLSQLTLSAKSRFHSIFS